MTNQIEHSKRVKGETGFTIIELGIVVAIIGILAAMVIPNFRRLVEKSRHAQVKGALSQIYKAEKSYFLENTGYTTRLDALGVKFDGEMHANVGFRSDTHFGAPGGTPGCNSTCPLPTCQYAMTYTCKDSALPLDGAMASFVTAGEFLAEANMISTAGSALSWTIDQTKTISSSFAGGAGGGGSGAGSGSEGIGGEF